MVRQKNPEKAKWNSRCLIAVPGAAAPTPAAATATGNIGPGSLGGFGPPTTKQSNAHTVPTSKGKGGGKGKGKGKKGGKGRK